jgi:Cys-rich repeat protein
MTSYRFLALVVGGLLLGTAAPVRAQVKKQEIIQEIQEAFKTWEAITCSKLKFEFAGEQPTYIDKKDGGILVRFGYDASTWSHQTVTYWTSSDFNLVEKGDLYRGTIELNARDFWWSIGKEKGKLDIRTAVLHMIPATIGFYVGSDPTTGSLRAFINYDQTIHALDPLHETGARFDYFEAGASCTQPSQPAICGTSGPTPDAGAGDAAAGDTGAADAAGDTGAPDAAGDTGAPDAAGDTGAADAAADASLTDAGPPIQLCIYHSNPNDLSKGKPLHWEALPIKYWIYIPDIGKLPGSINIPGDGNGTDAQSLFDGGPPKACTVDTDCPDGFVCKGGVCVASGGGGDDDGCCRVSHAPGQGRLTGTLVLLLGLVLVALRRRRG